MQFKKNHILKSFAVLTLGVLTACSDSDDTVVDNTSTMSGSVFASTVSDATCEITDANGMTVVGPFSTTADGTYSISLANDSLSQDLILTCSGGSFTDEASGLADQLAGKLAAYLPSGSVSSGTQAHATPSTTIIHDLVTDHAMNLSDAEMAFNTAFGYTPDSSVTPVDATQTNGGANNPQLLAGLRAAAFSQLAMDLGLQATEQFHLFSALAQDLSDGSLDGQDISGSNSGAITIATTNTTIPMDIQNRFNQAMVGFHSSDSNQTGLGTNQIGTLPFAKVALTASYKVEYVAGMMEAMEGKTAFKLMVTDAMSGAAVTGQDITLMPMMNMSTHHHSTPVDTCINNGDGSHDCTVYYLMPSRMMNGMSMGYWDLKVMVGGMQGEMAHFYPQVMMAMGGDSVQARLKGQLDEIPGMAMGGDMPMPEKRTYYLFKDQLSGMTGNHSLDLFVAAKESMMSYPGVYTGKVLNTGDIDYELSISSMSVEVSTDETNWITATDNGTGHWLAAGITGLTDATAGTIHVRLSVNGEQKTTNGAIPAGDGSNDYTSFTITPMSM